MRTILLVDDEYPSIEAIQTRVDWEGAGFLQVLTAGSVGEAKEQFQTHTVHVLLCDIEMPGESGLDLLQWMRTYSPETVGIFLTCHADFSYAKEAVRMGAFDYLLKPASIEDITRVVTEARREWESRFGKAVKESQWTKNEAAVIEHFWWDTLNELMPKTRERIGEQVEKKHLPIAIENEYLLAECFIRSWNPELTMWEKYDLDYTVKNMLAEVFEKQQPFLISDTMNRNWILFSWEPGKVPDMEELTSGAKRFMDFLKAYFKTKACFYIGVPCEIQDLADMYRKLGGLEKNNVSYDDCIYHFTAEPGRVEGAVSDRDEQEKWRGLLAAGKGTELCMRLRQYVNRMVEGQTMNGEVLFLLYHDVLQVVYSILAQHNISAQQLLGSYHENYKEALTSSTEMLKHLEHIIEASVNCMEATRHQESVVGKVQSYIEEHLAEDLSRNMLSGLVYLNPNYLARLFSSETGYSLVDYITKKRMERVKTLLLTTNRSITQIAQEVGYTNMPYFSRVFKKETGCTPVEYRKNGGICSCAAGHR